MNWILKVAGRNEPKSLEDYSTLPPPRTSSGSERTSPISSPTTNPRVARSNPSSSQFQALASYSTIPMGKPTTSATQRTPEASTENDDFPRTRSLVVEGPGTRQQPPPKRSSSQSSSGLLRNSTTSFLTSHSMMGGQALAVVPFSRPVTEKNPDVPSKPSLNIHGPHILVLGPQHAGKSSFVNSYRMAVTGHDGWSLAPVGRAVTRGTTCLEPYLPTTNPDYVQFVLLDTAGRRLKALPLDDDTSEDAVLYQRLLRGVKWKSSMVNSSTSGGTSSDSHEVEEANAADHVVLVLNALDLVEDSGTAYMWWRYQGTLERVPFLASVFQWFEHRLGLAPYVVVTHMDKVGGTWMENALRNILSSVVHRNHIFFVTNSDELGSLPTKTVSALRRLHECVVSDVSTKRALSERSVQRDGVRNTKPPECHTT